MSCARTIKDSTSGLISPSTFAATNFNYLIAGGGTAGLTLAVRLSEDPQITVGVIEAGDDRSGDPNVLTPGLKLNMWGNTSYDWGFKTNPQVHANSRVIAQPQGKQLGGSSAINFLYWTRASKQDIDDWGALGNSGWSWKELLPYFLKTEHFNLPSSATPANMDTAFVDSFLHGNHGPIQNGFPPYVDGFYSAWESTYSNLGMKSIRDPYSGTAIGSYSTLLNLDANTASRSYAVNAYYKPIAGRSNIKILTNALVSKIDFLESSKPLIATGVTFNADGRTYHVNATHEVILSAGVFKSPQLLELSGIGDLIVLERAKVDTLHQNPNVGKNLQDHLLVPLSFEAARGEQTSDSLRNVTYFNEQLREYNQAHTGILASGPPSAFVSFDQVMRALHEDTGIQNPFLKQIQNSSTSQDRLTMSKLTSQDEAFAQELYSPGSIDTLNSSALTKHYFTMLGVLEHPFSRGTVHIASGSADDSPIIDPEYLSHPVDLYLMGQIMLHLQQVARTPPLGSHLMNHGHAFQPGFYELNESNLESFIRNKSLTENHPIGTCSMGPEDEGGVVDEKLKVYGTQNLRVVDASIFPLLPRGNLQSLVYAVAERAADFIKNG